MIFASTPSGFQSRSTGHLTDLLLVLIGSSAVLVALILWFDNAQGGLTGNGVFKAMELKPWVDDPSNAVLYPANYLFYPVYGSLCRLLDFLGVYTGDPRRQITILNAASAGLSLCVIYLLARSLTGDRFVALLAALFHLASSHVMFLAIVNEDIMPSYTVMLAAMALASVWFPTPSAARVAAVSVLFSIAWLFEWRLLFPTLPAILVALWLCEPKLARRFGWIVLFVVTMLAVASLAAWISRDHAGAVGAFTLLWTGKAVNSVWAGFTWIKLGYLRDGIVAYLLGTGITTFPDIPGWDLWRIISAACLLAIAAVALPMLWRKRADNRARALASVFGVTFLAGEIFNLYSQPQDPQMQINVMAWVTIGWMLVLIEAKRRWSTRGLGILMALTVALFAYNVWSLAPLRGLDSRWREAMERLELRADLARTVFLLHDFDWTMVYASLHWGTADPGIAALGPAPMAIPKFKWIGFTGQVLRHPDWSTERHVEDLRAQIDQALSLGYEVIAVRLWGITEAQLRTETGMIADATRLGALQQMLRSDYSATLLFKDPVVGPVHRIERRPGR